MMITKQRQLIMEYFDLHSDYHPTAEDVYLFVKQRESKIGIATVYRNLKKLVENGILKELKLEKQGVRYDLAIQEHYHFVCDTCGNIENFTLEELHNINRIVEQKTHGAVTDKSLIFHGVCKSCLNK